MQKLEPVSNLIHFIVWTITQQQKQMHNSANHEEYLGQFEQAKQQVLTYVLSEQIPTSPLQKHRKKNTPKYHERQKLQLIEKQNNLFKDINVKEFSKNMKHNQNGLGRVIVLGSAVFKSNFQCGNICNVKMLANNTFAVELEKESNSNRQSAWFYFSVEGIRGQAHFIIQGFKKTTSLYSEGMKICYRDVKEVGSKWRRGGTRISYSSTDQQLQGQGTSYELRFSHFFKNNQHTCIEFAYCFPYGLKKLYHLMNQIKEYAQLDILGKSFNNQTIPLLTIGNKSSQKIIIISARVHPGETVSSFIMEGFLKELVGDNQFGKSLRSNYLFKIIPMINPDGVIKGNYRFSGYGCDLNRKWKNCKQNHQPQIFYMKQLIKNLNKQKKVVMFIDMHGHSRKKNVFFYGCCEKTSPPNTKPKEFPLLMEKISDSFKYENCCFSMQKDKEGTARITVWKQLKIDYVYTLQSSFCGPQFGPNYLQADFQKIGRKLCQGIAVFFYQDMQSNQKNSLVFKSIEKMASLRKSVTQQLRQNQKLMYMGEQDDSGSESQPQVGEIPEKQRNADTGLPKPQALINDHKKQQKSKKAKQSFKLFSQQSIRQNAISKTKSEVMNLDDDLINKINSIQLKNGKIQNTICIENSEPKYEKVQIKVANSINTFEMESLRASSLYQRNVRVHSITKNNQQRNTQRSRRVVNPFTTEVPTQEKEQKIRINLLHGRQGAQYRRVRKIAEQNLKKQTFVMQQANSMVKQLQPSQLQIGGGSKNMPIAPRFYPMSQQKGRKGSLQTYLKKSGRLQQFKRLSINGDELNVRCIGKHVFI